MTGKYYLLLCHQPFCKIKNILFKTLNQKFGYSHAFEIEFDSGYTASYISFLLASHRWHLNSGESCTVN